MSLSNSEMKRPLVWLRALIVVATAAAVAVTIFFGRCNYHKTARLTTEQFSRQQLRLARSAANGVNTYFSELSASLKSLAKLPDVQQMKPECLRCLQHTYWGFPKRTSLRLLDAGGVCRFIYPVEGWRSELVGRDYSKEAYFSEVMQTGRIGVYTVHNEQGRLRIRVAVPVRLTHEATTIKAGDGTGLIAKPMDRNRPGWGRFCGVMIGSFDPEDIARNLVTPIVSGRTGYAWLLNEKGVFLSHHEKEFVGMSAFEARAKRDPGISCEAVDEIQRKMLSGEEGTGRYISGRHRGKTGQIEKLVAYAPVHVNGKKWSLAISTPVGEVQKVIRMRQRSEFFTLAVVIAALTMGGVFLFVVSCRWSRSLEREVRNRTNELKETSDYLTRLIRFANAPIIVWSPAGKITIFNKAFEQMSGKGEAEMLGEPLKVLFPPESRSESLGKIESASGGQYWENVEIPILHKDGQIRVGLWNSANIYAEDSRTLIATIAQGQDITERKEVEESLRQSESRLRLIMENTSDGINIVEYDPRTYQRRLVMCNDRYVEMSGRSREELMANDNLNRFASEIECYSRPFHEQSLKTLPSAGMSCWLRPDGKENYYEWTATPLKVGDKYHIIGIDRDITERRQAEELQRIQHDLAIDLSMTSDLAESVDRLLETIFRIESIDCGGVYLVDSRTGDLELVSYKGLSQQFGENVSHYAADAPQALLVMKGEPLYGFYPKLFPSAEESRKQESLRAFATIPVKYEGKVIAVLNLASHTHDAIPDNARDLLEGIAAQIGGVIVRVRAEEGKAELEAQLRRAVKMEAVGRMAGGIAHDFNNMLAIIQGYADLLLKSMSADDEKRGDVESIRTAASRAAALTRQLLAFGRKQTIQPRVLDLNEVIADADSMLQRIIGEDIELVTKPGKDLWRVKVDPTQIEEQVIINLAVNAREAMPDGGRVVIETANVTLDKDYAAGHAEVSPGEYVMLSVSDTGVGMTEEVMSHIFEPFFTTRKTGKSSGLGLSTIYGIIKQSGGHIDVQSTLGKGSTFRLYLPRVKRPVAAVSHERESDRSLQVTETILVAEDEPSVRDLTCRILREQGYTVLEAADGKEAVRTAADRGEIHLLVTDVVMPHMSGKDLSEHVKTKHPGIKVLFISGYTDDAITHHGILHKGVNFLAKPFTSDQLTRTVRRVLDTDA